MKKIDYNKLASYNLNGIYKDMAEVLGVEITVKIYESYKGLQITFPTRLLSKKYIKEKIKKEYDGTNIKLLARKYGYSERWVRRMLED